MAGGFMETSSIDQVLAQLRSAVARTGINKAAPVAEPNSVKTADFATVFKTSLDSVNSRQQQAVQMAKEFELGVPGTNLQDVMISVQKANIGFQQTVQVRNRLVSAYHDIMNMQV